MTEVAKKAINEGQEELRDEILNSALNLFAQKGYFNTSVEDIKRASEVSTSKIYRYFKNKQAIDQALYNDLVQRMNDSLREIERTNNTAKDQIYAIIDFLFNLTEQAPDVMRFLLLSHHQEIIPDEKAKSSNSPFSKIIDVIDDGIKTGEILRINSTLVFGCFIGMVLRIIQLRLDGALEKSLDHYFHDVWSLVWNAIEAK